MARAPSVMSEDDGDDDRDVNTHVDVPPGLSGGNDTPRARETGNQDPPEYVMVEADDDFNPVSGPAAPQREEIRAEDPPAEEHATESRSRQRRKMQKEAARRHEGELRQYQERIERLETENKAFRESVTPRLDQMDQARYDEKLTGLTKEIDTTARAVDDAIERMSDAVAAGDTVAHKTAVRDLTKATQRGHELAMQRSQLETSRAQPSEREAPRERQTEQRQPQRQAPPPIDPEVRNRTQDFAKQFSWLNLTQPDRDSRVALMIDSEVAADGFDPRDDDYWEELEFRMREAPQLAHKFQRQQPNTERRQTVQRQPVSNERRGPMVGGAGNGSPASGPRQVLVSPERKNAMVQAGVLDLDGQTILDRPRFNRLAKLYMERDRANGAAR